MRNHSFEDFGKYLWAAHISQPAQILNTQSKNISCKMFSLMSCSCYIPAWRQIFPSLNVILTITVLLFQGRVTIRVLQDVYGGWQMNMLFSSPVENLTPYSHVTVAGGGGDNWRVQNVDYTTDMLVSNSPYTFEFQAKTTGGNVCLFIPLCPCWPWIPDFSLAYDMCMSDDIHLVWGVHQSYLCEYPFWVQVHESVTWGWLY